MERMRQLLNNKESELKRQIKTEARGVTQNVEIDIDNKSRVMAELSGVIQSGQNMLEENLDSALFIEKAVALENRISVMQTGAVHRETPKLDTLSSKVYQEAQNMEKTVSNALQKRYVLEEDMRNQGTTPSFAKEKVELISVETVSSKLEEVGCLSVNWGYMSGRVFDLKLSCPNGGGRTETIVISKITSNHFIVDRLRCDTLYQVSVSLQGQPETESDVMTCKTNKSNKMDSKARAVKKVVLNSVEPSWDIDNGALLVNWEAYDCQSCTTYDMKAVASHTDGKMKKTIIISDIDVTYDKLSYLFFAFEFDVSVMVHGRPETESNIITAKTPPPIVGPAFTLDASSSSTDVEIYCSGFEMMKKCDSIMHIKRYINLSGTVSSKYLESIEYWEVQLQFFMEQIGRDGDTAFEIGICNEEKFDNTSDVKRNYHSYVCCAARRGNSSYMEYYREGKKTSVSKHLAWKRPFEVHLGFFFNRSRRLFSIIDVETGEVLGTFGEIKNCDNYVAVFGTGCKKDSTQLKLRLITGKYLISVPEVIYEELL